MGGVSHLVIPTLALALPIAALLERLQSTAMSESKQRPSTAAARARGIPEPRVVWRHGWRQTLAPVQGIYGVRPADLGVVAAFPELSLAPGSTLLGTMLGKAFKRGAKDGEPPAKRAEKGGEPRQRKRMVAPLHGMGDVTERLQRRLASGWASVSGRARR
jgi:hypothetical protein